jgi:putative GTP pyrophosphokinase
MTPSEMRQAFIDRRPMLLALGNAVVDRISSKLQEVIGQHSLDYFLKIPPKPRVKDADSFMEKTARPGKTYANPLEDITDQVGCRFVVLREDQRQIVNNVIRNLAGWDLSKDRDVELQRLSDPHHFDYVSDHWVIRPRVTFVFQEVEIPATMPCEIQVRTLLQHAYAELAHSATYKPSFTACLDVRRKIGRGAALVETTDSVFVEVGTMIDAATKVTESLLQGAGDWYTANVTGGTMSNPFTPLAYRILESYSFAFTGESWATIEVRFRSKPWLANHIRDHIQSPLYTEPVILIVFYLVEKLGQQMPENWILPKDYLSPVFTALAISPGDSLQ